MARDQQARRLYDHALARPAHSRCNGGVLYLTQFPIAPDEAFDCGFEPPDAGTYWYHPHCMTMDQMARGLTGAMMIEEAEDPGFDTDVVLNPPEFPLRDDGALLSLWTAAAPGAAPRQPGARARPRQERIRRSDSAVAKGDSKPDEGEGQRGNGDDMRAEQRQPRLIQPRDHEEARMGGKPQARDDLNGHRRQSDALVNPLETENDLRVAFR